MQTSTPSLTSTKSISERLKNARKAAGYKSAKQFAQKNNIPPTTYSQHEASKRSLSIEVAKRYCEYLNINLCWLLTGETTEGLNILKEINPPLHEELCKNPAGDLTNEDFKQKLYDISRLQLTKIIDKELLSSILKRVHQLADEHDMSMENMGNNIANIYEDITNTPEYKSSQTQLIDIAMNSLIRHMDAPVAATVA